MNGLPANVVAGAYAAAQRFSAPVRDALPNGGAPESTGFADLVKQAVGTVAETGRAADAEAMQAATASRTWSMS